MWPYLKVLLLLSFHYSQVAAIARLKALLLSLMACLKDLRAPLTTLSLLEHSLRGLIIHIHCISVLLKPVLLRLVLLGSVLLLASGHITSPSEGYSIFKAVFM